MQHASSMSEAWLHVACVRHGCMAHSFQRKASIRSTSHPEVLGTPRLRAAPGPRQARPARISPGFGLTQRAPGRLWLTARAAQLDWSGVGQRQRPARTWSRRRPPRSCPGSPTSPPCPLRTRATKPGSLHRPSPRTAPCLLASNWGLCCPPLQRGPSHCKLAEQGTGGPDGGDARSHA